MSTTALGRILGDTEELTVPFDGDDWAMAWHPPGDAPSGDPHGANAFCVTADDEIVLVSTDGSSWVWPGGRPEHEIPFRRLVPAHELARHLWIEDGARPIYSRAAREAGLA